MDKSVVAGRICCFKSEADAVIPVESSLNNSSNLVKAIFFHYFLTYIVDVSPGYHENNIVDHALFKGLERIVYKRFTADLHVLLFNI